MNIRWPIDREHVRDEFEREKVQDGIMQRSYPSPYDIPEVMVIESDTQNRLVVFRFVYPSSGEKTFDARMGDMEATLGRHSKRIYALTVEIPKDKAEGFDFSALVSHVNQILRNSGKTLSRDNNRITQSLLASSRDLVPAGSDDE